MSCREAIEEVFAGETSVLSTTQVIDRVYAKYPDRPWKKSTISAHLIGLSVNHQTSRYYPNVRKHAFLFSLGNGRYRRWNPEEDGTWEVTDQGVRLVDSSEEAEISEETEEIEVAAVSTSLSLERDLEQSLLANLGQLGPNLQVYQDKGLFGQQLNTEAVGRLDILGIDRNSDLVGVHA